VSALPLDPALARKTETAALRAWRAWIGEAMRALADGETALPPRPVTAASDAVGRIVRQIELMAGALARDAA
jgi:hypothetical protein